MKLIIKRYKDMNDGTIGKFELIEGNEVVLKGYTLEPAGEDTTARGKDKRIPAGVYDVAWHASPKFGKVLPLLHNKNVSKDRFILIHSGNYPKDTEGCILLGRKACDEGVLESKATLAEFLRLASGKELSVEIINKG